jgi:1,4-alpha-glucan branching enzyme
MSSPMGATLTASGAVFRLWAPAATAVSVRGTFNQWADAAMARAPDGTWSACIAGVTSADQYKFFVTGTGSSGYKRDPYARSLTRIPAFPNSNCELPRAKDFPWHDAGFRPPPFHSIVLYQLHVGAYYSTDAAGVDRRRDQPGRFLDVLFRVEYLAALGVNAVQLLPIVEFSSERSLGYNGLDYFSPEMDYTVAPDDPDFPRYLAQANALLARRGLTPYAASDLASQPAQLMALIDLLHAYGIAVIFDVVYNHAGGGFDDESIYFGDRQPIGDNNRSLYFTDQGWAGGLVFAYWKSEVRQFLIDNACFCFEEYHVDGFRFDEVTVIDRYGGWLFLQHMTDTLRFRKPAAIQIAEYWGDQSAVLRPRAQDGAGFDAVVASTLREAIRATIRESTGGAGARINLGRVANALYPAHANGWRAVQHLENHDVVRVNNESDREPRVSALADSANARSWYARSRSRVANGLLLTAPGIPMLFMGQEFLEDKFWSDSPNFFADSLIHWDGLESDRAMRDHLRFIQELIRVRKALPALSGDSIRVFHVHDDNRVIAFHRWIEGRGEDVVVAVSLRESTWYSYSLGFPRAGRWREVFNSDVYDGWVNPAASGNGGGIDATGMPMHGFQASASVVLPANSILVFTTIAPPAASP